MTVIDIYNQFNVLPKSFIVSGIMYEHTTMSHSDGTWYAYIYEMKGLIRAHLHSFGIGTTEQEAIEDLIRKNTSK